MQTGGGGGRESSQPHTYSVASTSQATTTTAGGTGAGDNTTRSSASTPIRIPTVSSSSLARSSLSPAGGTNLGKPSSSASPSINTRTTHSSFTTNTSGVRVGGGTPSTVVSLSTPPNTRQTTVVSISSPTSARPTGNVVSLSTPPSSRPSPGLVLNTRPSQVSVIPAGSVVRPSLTAGGSIPAGLVRAAAITQQPSLISNITMLPHAVNKGAPRPGTRPVLAGPIGAASSGTARSLSSSVVATGTSTQRPSATSMQMIRTATVTTGGSQNSGGATIISYPISTGGISGTSVTRSSVGVGQPTVRVQTGGVSPSPAGSAILLAGSRGSPAATSTGGQPILGTAAVLVTTQAQPAVTSSWSSAGLHHQSSGAVVVTTTIAGGQQQSRSSGGFSSGSTTVVPVVKPPAVSMVGISPVTARLSVVTTSTAAPAIVTFAKGSAGTSIISPLSGGGTSVTLVAANTGQFTGSGSAGNKGHPSSGSGTVFKPSGSASHIGAGVGVASQVALKPSSSVRTTTIPPSASSMNKPPIVAIPQPGAHIQVPKNRVARLSSPGGAQLHHATISQSAKTITLPYSGPQAKSGLAPSGQAIPIARVQPQPISHRGSVLDGAHTVGMVNPSSSTANNPGLLFVPVTRQDPSMGQSPQTMPVNLTITDRSGGAVQSSIGGSGGGAAAGPSGNRPVALYPTAGGSTFLYEGRKDNNSITITTINTQQQPAQPHILNQPNPSGVSLGHSRVTPGISGHGPQDLERHVPGSPRPSILRKREGESTPVRAQGPSVSMVHPPSPQRPGSSGGSSTVSATSSNAVFSGDEQGAIAPSGPQGALSTPQVEPSPRKRSRKQILPPPGAHNVSPGWVQVKRDDGSADRMDWESSRRALLGGGEPSWEGRVRNWNSWGAAGATTPTHPSATGSSSSGVQPAAWADNKETGRADDEGEASSEEEKEKGGNFLKGKPRMVLRDQRHWKARQHHFHRYSDVKPKDERKPTVNELANQKQIYQKINGWKIYHITAGMEDIMDVEAELSQKFQDLSRRLEEAAHDDVTTVKVQELLKANIQRSKVIRDQMRECKQNIGTVFHHKAQMQDIITKYKNKSTGSRRIADRASRSDKSYKNS